MENNSGRNIWNKLADNGMQWAGELLKNANYENPISWESSGEIVYSIGISIPVLNISENNFNGLMLDMCILLGTGIHFSQWERAQRKTSAWVFQSISIFFN